MLCTCYTMHGYIYCICNRYSMRPSCFMEYTGTSTRASCHVYCIKHEDFSCYNYVFYITTTPYLPCNNNNINRKELYDFYYTAITLTTGYKHIVTPCMVLPPGSVGVHCHIPSCVECCISYIMWFMLFWSLPYYMFVWSVYCKALMNITVTQWAFPRQL